MELYLSKYALELNFYSISYFFKKIFNHLLLPVLYVIYTIHV